MLVSSAYVFNGFSEFGRDLAEFRQPFGKNSAENVSRQNWRNFSGSWRKFDINLAEILPNMSVVKFGILN